MDMWNILGIKATTDIAAIKKAYAERARECHPEEDPQGFQALHEAFVEAMELASRYGNKGSRKKKTQAAPQPAVFRSVPEDLRKLGQGVSVDGTGAAPQETPAPDNPVQEEPVRPGSPTYRFPSPTDMPEIPRQEQLGQGNEFDFRNAGRKTGRKAGTVETPPPGPQSEEAGGTPGYVFPSSTDQPAGDGPPEEGPDHAGEYRFPTGSPDAPPQPEQGNEFVFRNAGRNAGRKSGQKAEPEAGNVETPLPGPQSDVAGGTPGYVFPSSTDRPAGESPSTEQPDRAGEYRFPTGSPAVPQQPAQAGVMRGLPVEPTGAPLVFPGFTPPGGMAGADLPFMPLPLDITAEFFPQTAEDAERLQLLESARNQCLEEMQNLLERNAPEQDWYPILLGVDFTLVRHEGRFLVKLVDLCGKKLSLEMASALYMAYGFASDKSLRKNPATATLYAVLSQFLHLPQDAVPFLSLSDNLHRCDMALAGLVRLSAACGEPYVCGQAVRTPAFSHVKHQPYFIHRLTEFLEKNDVPEAWRQALAQAYGLTETQIAPSLLALAAHLPQVAAVQKPVDYNRAADTLLQSETALPAFIATVREGVLELLEKTRKGFPQSTKRGPWDYVFTRPEFALARRDWEFLTGLLSFLWEKSLPVGIWPALEEAYAAEFAQLPMAGGGIPEPGPDTPPEERATLCLMLLRDTLANHEEKPKENPSFLEILKSMLASI